MRRVIGIDTHRTFGEAVIWEDGSLRHAGRIGMTRTALEGFGKNLLATDEVVIEATGNCIAVSRVLTPFVKRVIIANPLQVKAIAHSQVKTDKIDAGIWPAFTQLDICRRSGRRMRAPSECVGLFAAAIKSSGIGRGSKTRSIRSCMLT